MKLIKPSFEILTPINGREILKKIEAVGRTCYKSEDKITDGSCVQFVKNLIERGHEAMIEHESISVRFITDRGVSHEIVRHRLASYAQESTRYCNYSGDRFGGEVSYIDLAGSMALDSKTAALSNEQRKSIYGTWWRGCEENERLYLDMIAAGATPQIARSVLNNSAKTEIVVTMNLREWRHFFRLRCAPSAHPAMRELTQPLLRELKLAIPVVFDDIEGGEV